MTTILAEQDHYSHNAVGQLKVTWSPLAGGDDGSWAKLAGHQLMSVAVELNAGGTFGTSTVAIQGRLATKEFVLNDLQDTALTGIAAAQLSAVQEPVESIRPVVAAGTGAGIRVTVWAKKVT